jgi:hypothetical protein
VVVIDGYYTKKVLKLFFCGGGGRGGVGVNDLRTFTFHGASWNLSPLNREGWLYVDILCQLLTIGAHFVCLLGNIQYDRLKECICECYTSVISFASDGTFVVVHNINHSHLQTLNPQIFICEGTCKIWYTNNIETWSVLPCHILHAAIHTDTILFFWTWSIM